MELNNKNEPQSAPHAEVAAETRLFETTDIFEFRKIIDRFINSTRFLLPTREMSLCYTELQKSFHWLGISLKEMGSQTPYKESENPSSAKIEPVAEHDDTNVIDFNDYPAHTERVKLFRSLLQGHIDTFRNWHLKITANPRLINNIENVFFFLVSIQNAYTHAVEAKCWLGWELGRIRDLKDNKAKPKPVEIPL